MTEFEKTKTMSGFSKGSTLWGFNRVVKKWLKYRKNNKEKWMYLNKYMYSKILYKCYVIEHTRYIIKEEVI